MRRILVIETAGLGWRLWERVQPVMPHLADLAQRGQVRRLKPAFPAVTVTCQATFLTGLEPSGHGMVANGLFHRDLLRAMFWEQSAALVEGERLWEALKRRRPEARSAMLFWQNSIGSGNDIVLTPAPIHRHGGGMIDTCYSVPGGLYGDLCSRLGRFRLRWYWGPFVSIAGTRWIARATAEVLERQRPDLVLAYLPHLDYVQQRLGPGAPRVSKEAARLDAVLGDLLGTARRLDYAVLLWGDYGIEPVSRFLSPNLVLRDAGLLQVRNVRGQEYLDLGASAAFAMVDHQVAHVYLLPGGLAGPAGKAGTGPEEVLGRVRSAFASCGEALEVLDAAGQERRGLRHRRSGELVLEARPGWWFDYRWWRPGRAPDFADHVDIHAKPGFDPCELFRSRWGLRTCTDPARVRGSHGRVTPAVLIAGADLPLPAGEEVPLTALRDAVLTALGAGG